MQDRWELFNTEDDPTEMHDLADQYPDKLQELIALWFFAAGEYNGLPIESRNAVEILTTPRPEIGKPRDRYTYYPDCAEVPEAAAVNIRNRSYTIAAEVDVHTPRPAACCSRTGPSSAGTPCT
jgi:arylsulfatase